ncbi:16S rRNA (guanine(527)-N(7))-methyltransferase RsmG [Herbihabitans rhizosphaerae]|uniref:16S rRNA (guanine(527)-N(7))-methyltransferase RsmG n=1 Tax=Herbihabitans rhizosphaerae TaxID=1872711 RepID=UPI003BF85CFF
MELDAAIDAVFGTGAPAARAYAELLERHGVERGLIGPREVDRLWERHLLNSAVIGEAIPKDARVVDVGSGAGLPGVPLAIARPDLEVVLLEPMARRVAWLEEVVETLGLAVSVVRGRAEERSIRASLGTCDVVTARAVAPLARLCGWCLPLVRSGGSLVALKGASAADEVARDREEISKLGGSPPQVTACGQTFLDTPTTVVVIERTKSGVGRNRKRRTREDL